MNCHRNYPWYRGWDDELSTRGLKIVGVHTPETNTERDVESVAQRAVDARLEFPILVDNERTTWNAWGNRVWPSVYVIDKQGYLRYWWFGELNWRDAGGQTILRDKILELLAE